MASRDNWAQCVDSCFDFTRLLCDLVISMNVYFGSTIGIHLLKAPKVTNKTRNKKELVAQTISLSNNNFTKSAKENTYRSVRDDEDDGNDNDGFRKE